MNDQSKNSLEELRINDSKILLYKAGLPNYPRNFTRDSIISAILMQNPEMLKQQLLFCAERQGKKKNPYSGEEPGKIFHEYPPVKKRKLSTEYNACDTTALFLIGHEIYQRLIGNKKFKEIYRKNISQAVNYIKTHLRKHAFIEDPKFCGNNKFALKVTYWKDSELYGRKNGEPVYPVVYSLAHIQNMRALRSAAFLLNDKTLEKESNKMRDYFNKNLIDKKTKMLYLAIDVKGPINAINSDMLHVFFYLEKKDVRRGYVKCIVKNSTILETKKGYMTICKECTLNIKDKYHANTVWPFEQALINIGAKKFNLSHVAEVSSRITKYLNTNPEIFKINGDKIEKWGDNLQLWTIAAKDYFNNNQDGIFP